VEKITELAQYF